MDMLKKLSSPVDDPDAATTLPHILGGDFNTTGRTRLYEGRLQEEGAMDLVDSHVPTNAGGTAIDAFLYTPGACIPSTLLPYRPGPRKELDHHFDAPSSPAHVIPYTDLSDHMPILLPIPCEAAPKQVMRLQRIRIDALSDETWLERDPELSPSLEREWPRLTLGAPLVNIARHFGIFRKCISRVFRRGGESAQTYGRD